MLVAFRIFMARSASDLDISLADPTMSLLGHSHLERSTWRPDIDILADGTRRELPSTVLGLPSSMALQPDLSR